MTKHEVIVRDKDLNEVKRIEYTETKSLTETIKLIEFDEPLNLEDGETIELVKKITFKSE